MISKKYLAPNAITATSMFLGFLSIISSINGEFDKTVLFIIFAMICDGLDGKTARKLDAFSEFGKEFDSFADAISFGIAPAILLYCKLSEDMTTLSPEVSKNIASLVTPISFLYAFCGVMRLVKFNVVTVASSEKDDFSGMPIPNAASMVCSYYIICHSLNDRFKLNWYNPRTFMAIAAIAAILMVSTIPFKTPDKSFPFIPKKFFNVFVLAVLITWRYSLFIFTALYLMINILNYLKKRLYGNNSPDDPEEYGEYIEEDEFEEDIEKKTTYASVNDSKKSQTNKEKDNIENLEDR